MAYLTDSQILDLANGTLKKLGRNRFQQIAQTLRSYDVFERIMRKDRIIIEDGTGIRRNLMISHTNDARQVGLYQDDVINVGSHNDYIEIGWRHTTNNMGWERRELLMNRGESRIWDVFKTRYTNMILGTANHMETLFWSLPASATDKDPHGVPYWIVKGSNSEEGFVGDDPYSGVGAGGVLVADAPGWSNYFADYAAISDSDGLKKMRTGYRKMQFKAPRVTHEDYKQGADDCRIYCNDTTIMEMEDILRRQNDNLGRELAKYQNDVMFMGRPVRVAEKLNADTTNPVYFINFAYFHICFLAGDYMRETGAMKSPFQHNAFVNHLDMTWNILCTDRRRQAVFAQVS